MATPPERAAAAAIVLFSALLALLVFRPGQESAAAVTLGDPTAWIEHGMAGELLGVNGITGEVTSRIPVAEPGVDFLAVSHGDGAAVLDASTEMVSLISASTLDVTAEISIGQDDGVGDAPVPLDDGSVDGTTEAVFGQRVDETDVVVISPEYVVDVVTDVGLVDQPGGLSSQEPIATGLEAPLTSPVQNEAGEIFALDRQNDSVVRVGADGAIPIAFIDASVSDEDQRQLIGAGGKVLVLDPERLSMFEIDSDGTVGNPICMRSAANGAVHGGSGLDGQAVVASLDASAGILATSFDDGVCTDVNVDVDAGLYGPPVILDDVAYLPYYTGGRIISVSLDSGEILNDVRFGTPGRSFELDVIGSTVWANERLGPFAAVVEPDDVVAVAKVSAILLAPGEGEDGEGAALAAAENEASGLRAIGDDGDAIRVESTDVVDSDASVTDADISPTPEPLTLDESELLPAPEVFGISVDGVDIEELPIEEPEDELLVEPEPEPEPAPEPEVEAEPEPDAVEPLVANFSVSSNEVTVGEVVRFVDTSTGVPVSWAWTFGDGDASSLTSYDKAWDEDGLFEVTLTVLDAEGQSSVQTTEVRVVPEDLLLAPNADFSFSSNTIEEGESITFESQTTGEVDTLIWAFGDGERGEGETVTHRFARAGTYEVVLTAANEAGFSTSEVIVRVLESVDPPIAAIARFPATVLTDQFVNFRSASENEPTSFSWRFGDTNRATGQTAQHSWSEPGTYRIVLQVENSEGTDQAFADITVERRTLEPVSRFTQTATQVEVGESVRFTNTSLNEPNSFAWDFGDGEDSDTASPSHSWDRPGTYRVTLQVTNDAGSSQSGVTVTVVAPVDPPVASFEVESQTVATGQDARFRDTSSNNPTSWRWAFENSGEATNQNPYRRWSSAGTYTVRLTASNEGGSSSAETTITVIDPPTAAFTFRQIDDNTFQFTEQSNNVDQYRWDFGDGTTSTEANPRHTFGDGSFEVTLRTTNEVATAGPARQQITISEPPVATISCEVDGRLLTCSGADSERASSFRWSADGAVTNTTPTAESTTFSFDTAGRKEVTLVVTDADGVAATATLLSSRVQPGLEPRILDVEVVSVDGDRVVLEATFDRDPTSWEWTFGNAEVIAGGNSSTATVRIDGPGTYNGQVIASNQFGDDIDPVSFTIEEPEPEPDPEPVASFEWTLVEPGIVRFTNTSSMLDGADVIWRFNRAQEVIESNESGALVRYTEGNYTAVLVIVDNGGRSTTTEDIDVPSIEPDPPEEEQQQDPPEEE